MKNIVQVVSKIDKEIIKANSLVSKLKAKRKAILCSVPKVGKLKVPKKPPFEPFCELKAEYSEDRSRGGEDIDC